MKVQSPPSPATPARLSLRPERALWLGLEALAITTLALLALFLGSPGPGGASGGRGRLVDAGPVGAVQVRQPIAFAQDDFYLIRLDDSSFAALYAYPPGFFGHEQGCRIHWDLSPVLNRTFQQNGIWSDGCGGSRWDPPGHRLSGPAPRDLDRFRVSVSNDHVFVDTRRLICAADPCERLTEPVTQFVLTLTDRGFQPAHIELPAGKPAFVILKNEANQPQDWHLLGVVDVSGNAARSIAPALRGESPFADGSDVHTLPTASDDPLGVPFTVDRRGTYTFVSDADPARLRGTLVVR